MKKVAFVAVLFALPLFSHAADNSFLINLKKQIQETEQRLAYLKAQLAVIETASSTGSTSTPPGIYNICLTEARNSKQGSSGDHVAALQEFLKQQGHFVGAATGYFGPITKAALTAWQKNNGIGTSTELGSFGDASRGLLRSRVCEKFFSSVSGTGTSTPPKATLKPAPNPVPPLTEPPTAKPPVILPPATSTQPLPPITGSTIPLECKTWTDGCNTCTRSLPGGLGACTLKACMSIDGTVFQPTYSCLSTF